MTITADPATLITVLGVAVLAVVGFVARRRPSALVLAALVSLALSARYLDPPAWADRSTFASAKVALDDVHKIGLTAVALLYAHSNGVDRRRLLPIAALGVIAVLTFGPAVVHPELTPLQTLRSFIALSTTWLLFAVRRTPGEAQRQLVVVALLPGLNLAVGVLLWTVGLNDLVRHEYTGAWRLQGASIPAHLGILCVVAVAAGTYLWSRGSRWMGLLVAANLGIAVVTGTRTAIVLCVVLVIAGLISRTRFLRTRHVLPSAIAYLVVLGAVGYAYLPALRDRFLGNPLESGFNTSGRADAWDFFWRVAQVEPMFGRGLGAATVANTGQLPPAFKVPHNEYLRLVVEGGWVGLTLFLVAAGVAFSGLVRRTGASGLSPAVVVSVWAGYCFVDNALSTPQGSVTFPIVIAAMAASKAAQVRAASAGASVPQDASGFRVPTVVYIAGASRSGSTLLERALSRLPGVVAGGELVHAWRRGAVANELCSCGLPFRSCPFWIGVGSRLPGGWEAEHVQEVLRLQQRTGRHRLAPLVLFGLLRGRRRMEADQYVQTMAAMYIAIADQSGASIVVDSSKLPITAHVLGRSRLIDLRVLHLVRDSRAHAFAMTKVVPRPEAPGEFMPRAGPLHSCVDWLGFHVLAAGLRGCSNRYVRVAYEDFARHPRRTLDDVMWLFDRIDNGGIVEDEDGEASLDLCPWHGVSGNPVRFAVGPTRIHLDEEWRRALPARERRLVTLLTAPGLLCFGYLTRPLRGLRRLLSRRPRRHWAGLQTFLSRPVPGVRAPEAETTEPVSHGTHP
jgi:O-antigen ligase